MRKSGRAKVAAVACIVSLVLCGAGTARVIYVDNDGPADFNTIQAAVDDANDGDTVIIQPGVYTGPGNRDISFLGKAITVQSVDPLDRDVVDATIIDCGGSEDEPHRGFLFIGQEGPASILAGVTITNGYGLSHPGASLYSFGGGIYVRSNPTITHCVISGNRAKTWGGGICAPDTARPYIGHCIVEGNWAGAHGGGVFCTGAIIDHCLLVGNSTDVYGGAISCSANAQIGHCTIFNNRAGSSGGGISPANTTRISNCIIWGNQASPGTGDLSWSAPVRYCNVGEGRPTGVGNIIGDPCFANADHDDYHLLRGSPCINAGDPNYEDAAATVDLDGRPRVLFGRVDIGAYEFSADGPYLFIRDYDFVFEAEEGKDNPERQTLTIRNTGNGVLQWTATEDCPWLRIDPNSGEASGDVSQPGLLVHSSGLARGLYRCAVTVSDPHALNGPETIYVTLHVEDGDTVRRVPSDYATIQDAIDWSQSGDTVEIADGTYAGSGNRDIDFRGKAITVRGEHGPRSCVIDCAGSENELHRGFIFQSGEGNGSILSGLTITNGYTSNGGAVYCSLAGPTIRNCVLTGNAAENGGGIAVDTGNASIENCLIWGNRTVVGPDSLGGGGVYFEGCQGGRDGLARAGCATRPRLVGCTVADNTSGGGVCAVFGCDVTIANCIIRGNTANQQRDLDIVWYVDSAYPSVAVSYSNIGGGLQGISRPQYVKWGKGNLDAAPGFVNPQAGDYRLRTDSPCVDTGDPNYVPVPDERDIDGEPRMMNGRIDMGTDELTAALIPTLAISKSQFLFDANEGETNPATQSFIIYNAVADSQLAWEILHDCSWLRIDPMQGQSSGRTQEAILAPDIANLARGVYVCDVKINSTEAIRSPQTVRVELAVHGPVLELSTSKLSLQGVAGQADPPSQTLRLMNRGSHAVVWRCQPGCDWISVHPALGTTAESDEITVTVDPTRLVGGTYKCDLVFSDSNAEDSPRTVIVTATLADNDGLLEVPAEYPTIQAAINAAGRGERVLIMPGTYTGPGNYNLDLLGKVITVGSADPDDWAVVAATVIDCQGLGRGFNIRRSEKGTTVIEGLTITGGYTGTYGEGGGMNVWAGSSPTIRKCVIRGNLAAFDGGGVACNSSGAAVIDCHIIDNTAGWDGGGVGCTGSGTVIKGCTISGNAAGHGGGICLDARLGSLVMSNCLLAGNSAKRGGGVSIAGDRGAVTIDSCTVVSNTATDGGGICYEPANQTNAEIANSILWANSATNGPELAVIGPTYIPGPVLSCTVRYSDVRGGAARVYIVYATPRTHLDWGIGNLDADPLFADPANGDYHLKSQAGRWEPGSGSWVIDEVTSPCIDAGDPNSPVEDEPEPNGGRINMGAYGGTAEASKSYPGK